MTNQAAWEAASPAEQLLREGFDHCQTERWHAAAVCFQQAAVLEPGNCSTRYYLGMALNNLGRHEEAARHLEMVVAKMPAALDALFHLGLAHKGQNRHRQAIACFLKVLDGEPDQPETWFHLAQSRKELGLLEEAKSSYEQAIARRPVFYQALFNLGNVMLALGEVTDAERCFRQVVDLVPDRIEAWTMLGRLTYEQGRYPEAIGHLHRAVALAPESPSATYNLGLALHKNGNRREGLAFLATAISRSPATPIPCGPLRIRIEASSCCNLRCRHCPTGVSYRRLPRTLMTEEIFDRVIADLRKMPNLSDCVMYLGGEPLLHPRLAVMITRIKSETSVRRVMLNSNGMLLEGKIADELAGCGVDLLEISIDGRSPAENDAIRRGADYLRIKRNIGEFIARNPTCRIAIANTVTRQDGDPTAPACPAFLLQDFPALPIQTSYAMAWPGLDLANSLFTAAMPSSRGTPEEYCNKPFTEMAVRANGDVVPCCYDLASEQVMGNIADTPLLDIWYGGAYRRLRGMMAANALDDLPGVCRKCIVYSGSLPLARTGSS